MLAQVRTGIDDCFVRVEWLHVDVFAIELIEEIGLHPGESLVAPEYKVDMRIVASFDFFNTSTEDSVDYMFMKDSLNHVWVESLIGDGYQCSIRPEQELTLCLLTFHLHEFVFVQCDNFL